MLGPLAANPRAADAATLNNLALALARLGRNDEAAETYRRCLDRHPDYAPAHFGLGEVLQAKGELLNAMGEYEAGLATRDDWPPALNRLAPAPENKGRGRGDQGDRVYGVQNEELHTSLNISQSLLGTAGKTPSTWSP